MIDQLSNSFHHQYIQTNIHQMMKNQDRILSLYHTIYTTFNNEEQIADPTLHHTIYTTFNDTLCFQYVHEAKGTVTLHISIMV